MGPWTSPSFNIYRLDFTLDFIFDAINRFHMKRTMRIGLTHPIPGRQNEFVHPSDMRKAIERLYAYRPRFDAHQVSPAIDCGFPRCQFTQEEMDWINPAGHPCQFSCGPGLDISPDMTACHCLPLSDYRRRSILEFESMKALRDDFLRMDEVIRSKAPGIYDECTDCLHRKTGVCSGGGLCHILNRLLIQSPEMGLHVAGELPL
jgi:hypothetical protein